MSTRLAGRLVRAVLAAALVLLATVVGASPASAHATLLSTSPVGDELVADMPSQIELVFDEPVEVVDGAIRVLGPDGDRADRGRAEVTGPTVRVPVDDRGEGTYTVAWRVVSQDGHNIESAFVFHVRTQTGMADLADDGTRLAEAAGAVGRFWALCGLLVLFGAIVVRLLAGSEQAVADRLRPVAAGGAVAGLAGTVLVLVASAAIAAGRPLLDAVELIPDFASDTRPGRLAALRILLLGVALAAVWWRRAWLATAWVALGAVGATMALLSASGHAWTADQRALAWSADLGHLVAAGTWVGGAAALLAALRATADPGGLATRFSAAALVAAGVVGATGVVSAAVNTGSWEALTTTGYGRLVGAKAVGFAVLVGFGWVNRRRLVPLAERTAAPLLRSLRWEVLAAVAVVAVTAVLVDQPPGRSTVVQAYDSSETVDEITAQLTVDPARTGANELHLYLSEAATGAPLAVDAAEITVGTEAVPARRLDVVPITPSHLLVYDASLPTPGTWTVEVTLVRGGTPTTIAFEVPIR
jgi:copper transport protein